MTRRVTLTLNDDEYAQLLRAAEYYERTIPSLAADMLAQHLNDWEECVEDEAEFRMRLLLNCPPAGNA